MENIKELILAKVSDAVIEDKQYLTVTVKPEDLRTLAKMLRYDEGFDYLIQLTGVDYGDSLGVVYLLAKSEDMAVCIVMKTATADKENPTLPTVSDMWKAANWNEREVYDYFGVIFIDHPDMRHLFMTERWKGYPLRKDYDASRDVNPLDLKSYDMSDTTVSYVSEGDGIKKIEKNLFEEEDYVVNIGPQHPATHGVLHFRTALDGEIIKKIDANCGYIHRGVEKLCEGLTYPQSLHFTDRLDYLSAHIYRHGLCMCVEKAAGIEVPERAEVIRTIMDELQRIDSHLIAWSCMCQDMSALTAFIYGMRDREKILDIFEETGGGRLIQNYNVIGGVMADIHPNFVQRVKDFIPVMRKGLKEYHQLYTGNVIARERMIGVGVMSKETAIAYGVTGPSARASGIHCDLRKMAPYAAYDKVEFKEIIRTEGDSMARYMNRLDEIEESLHIIEQLIDNIPEGDFCAKTKAIIKLPEGEYFQRVEGGRGEWGVYILSKGDKTPYRMKFRSPCMTLVNAMDTISRGGKIADLITIGGSMDYIIPDIDR
ncbi:MAG: NADH-quinone oxidoreductase subunit C [Bacteroidales bacterium]|nr:NADH-quinone oxidoreductase subunit C [Bacteroidales bacterium]MDD3907110.1 NADH-quinone oxidoreductase subunit C [Bacteroidales bacterium]MDD4711874.1 NADH-quinone oxidoreductase subunit C [Bacteroidales bacterium]